MTKLTRNVKGNGARTLGLLLIAFILYGTTVEAAHRHGRILSPSSASSVTNSSTSNTSSGIRTGCNDCLICQLHQNFSTGLISLKEIAEESDVHSIGWQFRLLLPRSIIKTPSTGRAPPISN